MVVTLTVDELLVEMRLGDSTEERALCQRRLDYSAEAVVKYAPLAPEITMNEAVVRRASFLFDMPTSGAMDRYANPLRSSGAARILTDYRMHGGGLNTTAAPATSGGNFVISVMVDGGDVVAMFADGTETRSPLPASAGGLTVVNVQRVNDDATITYSDGSSTTFSLATGLQWPGL